MTYSVEEAIALAKSEGKSNKINNNFFEARRVDPDNLPSFMQPQPEPQSIGQKVADAITTAVGNPFEAREEEATAQAQEQYQNYQNEEIAQPVGVGNMLASAGSAISGAIKNPGEIPGAIMQAAEDTASSRAADNAEEYQKTLDDIQNPVAPNSNAVDEFFHAGLLGPYVGDAYQQGAERTLAFSANWVRGTEIYNNFNFQWDTPEKNRMSEELARAYGVNSGIFFGDRDAYIKGAQILAQFKIDSRVGDDVDRNDPEAFKAYLAEYYPSLANASPDTFEAMLKNAEDVKAIQSVTQVPALVAEEFANADKRANIYGKAYLEGRALTEEETARAQVLTKRLGELEKMIPQTTLHPLLGVLTQTGIQVAGMGSDAAVGAVAAGILGGGAYMMGAPAPLARKIGGYAFKIGTMAGMYRRQVGEKYIEYLSYQNEDGSRTLTPAEAKLAATIETGVETGIEFWNYDAIMSTLGGADRAAIQDIVARNKGNAEAIKGGLKGYLATAVKSWAPRAKEEILEEAYQSATGDIVHNAIVATHPQTTEKMVSVPEIAANSMDAMADAVPSVGGMIIGGDILSNIKGVRSLASIARLHNTMTEEAVDNAFTGQVLRDIQENQKDNKLFKENPKAYMQVIKTEMDKAGLPNVYVDVEMLMNEKGGAELVQKLGQQSGYSPAEIQQVIESKGDLEVPTEVYCQTALPANDKIVDMTTSSPDINCTARQKDTIKRFQQNVKALAEQDEQEVQEIIPTIVNENFSDDEERKLATEIISGNPNDVQNAYKKALRNAEQEYKNVLREVWEREEADSKENHDGTRIVEDRYADDNGNVRVVNNHGTWRDKWWTDYFGIGAPTVEKKEQFAYDIMTGAVNGGPNSLGRIRELANDHGDMDEVARIDAEFKANKERLDKMANTIATLREMEDKIAKIQNVETTITRGMTPEAYRVYQHTTDLLSASPNKKVQQAARYDGVLFARMCQRLAEEWTRQGKKTTAEDVANTLQIVPTGKVGMQEPTDNSLFKMKPTNAHSLAEFYNAVKENVNSNGKEKAYYRFFTKWGDPIDVAQDDVRHFGRKHALTGNQFEAIENSLGNVTEYQWDTKKKGHNGGSVCRLKSSSTQGVFGATIEVLPSGRIFLTTAFFDSEKNIDNWLYKEKAPRTTTSHQNGEASSSRMAFNKSILDAIGFVNGGKEKLNQQQAQIQGQTTVTGDMISLFDAADQSTFMHESAHWYLINMQKLALNENASRQFVEDFMTLQQWFGNKKLDADISVGQHEKFARGFEAYLRTGKAPAPQLHGIFNRFKTWLTAIYRDFKQLGGKPTKEVTAVMDRMLATEDEISMAMKEQMVDDFKRAGGMKLMLDENARTWERWYQKVKEEAEAKVLEKAMKDLEAADQKDIAEAIEAKRNEIAEEMGQDQFWRADEMVRMNGGDLDVLADFGFTPEEYRAELENRGGSFEAALESQLKGFRAEMQESRIDQNELYEDAKKAVLESEYQEMLHALEYEALAAKAKAYIAGEDEAAAKAQAREDKVTEKANKEAAEAAEKARKITEKLEVQEDQRNEKVKEAQTEMRNMKAGIRIVRDTVLKTVSERRAMARQSLATLPINQATNVALWAKKLGQKQYEVFRLMSVGEWSKAANAKQQQLLLAAMVTESGRIKKLIDQQAARIQKNIQTLQKGNERMPPAERYWYQHLAYVLGLARNDGLPPSKGIPKLEELFLWLTGSPNEKESEVKIPQWLDALGNQTQRIGMEKLSPNGWEYVNKIMKALYKMSRQKDKLNVVELNGVKGARIEEAANALANNLIEHNGIHIKEDPYDANRWTDKRKRNMNDAKDFLGSYFNKLIAPLTIFQRMDGYIGKTGKNATGLAIKTLYDPVMRATNEEIKLQAEFAAGLKDAFGAYTGEELDDIRNKRIYRFGNRLLTKEQIMCMALTAGTESGYKRVLDNEPVGQEFKSLQIRERVVADLFNDVLKNLDARDWATVTKIWNLMGAHYEDESGVKERTTGIPLGKLAHRSFSITGKDGNTYQLQGGYYPVVYDSDQSVRASDLEQTDALKSMAPGVARMGQGKGFTKSRATTVTDRPLSLSFDVIGNKGGEMMHYIAFRETALDVNRIINDRKFTKAVVDSMGMEEYRALQAWASDIWQPPKDGMGRLDKLVKRLRTRTTAAVLAYRTSTALLNVANAPLMMMYCGVDNFMSAFKTFWAHPSANWRLVNSLSPFMAQRSERMDTNLREAMESQNKKLHASKITQAIMGNGFKIIGFTDNMFAYPLWFSEYRKVLNEEINLGHDNETAQKAAVSAGDRAVVRVIGSGEMKDLSRAQKGGEMAKALTMFYTFQNALYNMAANKYYAGLQAAEAAGKTGWRRYASSQFLAPMAHYFLLGVMVNSMIELGVRGVMDAVTGSGDKEKKDADYWLRKYAQTSMDNQAATVPILRDIWRLVSRSIWEPEAKMFGTSAKMTSALDSFVRLSDAGVTTVHFARRDGQKNLADFVRDGGRAINGIVGSPDMVTDGIANSVQYFLYPNSERDLLQLLGAIAMDRKLAKPKKNTAKKTGDPFKDAKKKAQRERNAAKKKAKNGVK
ncbi:hypothetical protein [Acidaminococcus massiliensis]|uniref:hypothetical protein n=1 Tax=Acidaminococcus massiliensis TaxID=1852375 RepID=UPI0022E75123|nr:hypothetical protein [Acidaminococcus massiliensis]